MPALIVQSPVLDMAEGISDSSDPGSGLLTKLVVVVMLIAVAAIAAKKWFFPYSIEHLESLVKGIGVLIKENTTLEWNLLGDSARYFKRVLERYVKNVAHLESLLIDFYLSDASQLSLIPAYAHLDTLCTRLEPN